MSDQSAAEPRDAATSATAGAPHAKPAGTGNPIPAPTAATDPTKLTEALFDLRFDVERSLRYHMCRRAHFEFWHRAVMFTVIICGSAVIAQVNGLAVVAGVVSMLVATVDLVIGLSGKARDHHDLQRKFGLLGVEMDNHEQSLTNLKRWRAEKAELDASEAGIYWALNSLCHNEVINAWGKEKSYLVLVPPMHRRLANFVKFTKTTYPRVKDSVTSAVPEAA